MKNEDRDLACLLDYARKQRSADVRAIAEAIRQGSEPIESRLTSARYWLKFERLIVHALDSG